MDAYLPWMGRVTNPPRQKKCKVCREGFRPFSSTQVACSLPCALSLASAASAKARKAETKAARERLKTRGDYLKECQQAFNAWIRERDHAEPCISCQRHHTGQYHAGHYLTVGAHPELRFHADNCHKQCAPCNNHLSGNIVEYRKGLLAKIGPERLDWLEGKHEPVKYTIDEIKEMTKHFRAEAKRLKLHNQGQA